MILDKLGKLARRERVGLAVAALVMLLLLIDRVVVQSVLTVYGRLNAQIDKAKKAYEYNLTVLQRAEEVADEYGKVGGLIKESPSFARAVDDMKGEIDELATRTKVSVSMKHRDGRVTGVCEEYTVDVPEFEADLQSLLRFLNEAQISPGLLRVVRLTFSPNKGKGTLKGSMTLTKVMVVPADGAAADAGGGGAI